ncbi:MAG: L-aspartate oxidase [Nitrospirae bacterium]|nr:MAG: L-aspartate oxidase [Nitrospirota bacterium]
MNLRQGPEADFLVIGSGVAGLRAAIELAAYGQVLIVTKGSPLESNSVYAQGGVAVAMSEDDDVHLHFTDTLNAGHQLGRKEAARALVEEGPDRIQELIEWGAQFDTVNGKLAFAREGAHSRRRVLRAKGDATGIEIVRVLLQRAREQPSIHWLDGHYSIDLVVQDGRCCGVLVMNELSSERCLLRASAVILATGGAGQVFARTTNPPNATGDGIAMAYRAGAVLEDMEFVQFHPTALYLPSTPPFLLSEAIRGEGGILRNRQGERFMPRYHPDAELAPRDIVARAIWSEMAATRARHVFLDVTHLDSRFLKQRFPTIYTTCLRFDIDITEEWIPVSPSAHYLMGGIQTNIDGETSVPGLYAAGEVACSGVHGANRLASNSLLEGLVFGVRAARAATQCPSPPPGNSLCRELARLRRVSPQRLDDAEKLRNSLRRLMWNKVGLVRTGESLASALAQLSRWERALEIPLWSRADLEVKNMVQVGRCIAEAALWRENSLGAHFRADFPTRAGSAWKLHSHITCPSSPFFATQDPPVQQPDQSHQAS